MQQVQGVVGSVLAAAVPTNALKPTVVPSTTRIRQCVRGMHHNNSKNECALDFSNCKIFVFYIVGKSNSSSLSHGQFSPQPTNQPTIDYEAASTDVVTCGCRPWPSFPRSFGLPIPPPREAEEEEVAPFGTWNSTKACYHLLWKVENREIFGESSYPPPPCV